MSIAALYDIHGNLPALDAVLNEVRQIGVEGIVIGGDVVPGPMPRETLDRLLHLDIPTQFILGNGELAMLAQMAASRESEVAYWGTTSGKPMPEQFRPAYRWTVQEIRAEYESVLKGWLKLLRVDIPGLGTVLFCHGTPRSEVEVFTRLTSHDRLLPLFKDLDVSAVVCGHTHMQFDRMVGATRVINAGSIGEPYGSPGACWALLGPGVELRRTGYEFTGAADLIRKTSYPDAEEFAEKSILNPPSENEMLGLFGKYELLGPHPG